MFEHSGHYRFSEEAPLFLKTMEEFLKQERWTAWGKFSEAATVSILIYCISARQVGRISMLNRCWTFRVRKDRELLISSICLIY